MSEWQRSWVDDLAAVRHAPRPCPDRSRRFASSFRRFAPGDRAFPNLLSPDSAHVSCVRCPLSSLLCPRLCRECRRGPGRRRGRGGARRLAQGRAPAAGRPCPDAGRGGAGGLGQRAASPSAGRGRSRRRRDGRDTRAARRLGRLGARRLRQGALPCRGAWGAFPGGRGLCRCPSRAARRDPGRRGVVRQLPPDAPGTGRAAPGGAPVAPRAAPPRASRRRAGRLPAGPSGHRRT